MCQITEWIWNRNVRLPADQGQQHRIGFQVLCFHVSDSDLTEALCGHGLRLHTHLEVVQCGGLRGNSHLSLKLGMSGTWEPSASHLPKMSSVAGFGVNGSQRRSANTEPLHITAAPTFDFSTEAKQQTVAGPASRQTYSRLFDCEREEGPTTPLVKKRISFQKRQAFEASGQFLCIVWLTGQNPPDNAVTVYFH